MYVANVRENGFENNPLPRRGAESTRQTEGAPVVAVCAAIEAEIADMDDEDKGVFLADMGMSEPGLDRVIHAGYELLGLQTYFTAGAEGSARVDGAPRRDRAAGGGRDPHRFRERLHSRRSDRVRRLRRVQGRAGREGSRQDAARRQGLHRAGRRRHALPLQRLTA